MTTMTQNRIDEWIARVKSYGAIRAFDFIPGYPAHKTPSPFTKYTVAVTEDSQKISRFFIGNRIAAGISGRIHQVELRLRVFAPEGSSGASLLRASSLLMDALEAKDSDRMIDSLLMTGIGYDTAARVEYRDVVARLSLVEEAVA